MKLEFCLLILSCRKKLFKIFKAKYSRQHVDDLNMLLGTRNKLCNLQSSIKFLQRCMVQRVVPKFIDKRIMKSKLRSSLNTEKIFLTSEIDQNERQLQHLKVVYLRNLRLVMQWMGFIDFIRFQEYSTTLFKKNGTKRGEKFDKLVTLLKKRRYGNNNASVETIKNLSSYKLTDDEQFVLSHGLGFHIPPNKIKREHVLSEFEVLAGQLKHHVPVSAVELNSLKARLTDLAYAYSGTPVASNEFCLHREFSKIIKRLKCMNDIVITKPDKGSGVVILDKSDYLEKMSNILDDRTKFELVGPTLTHDNTVKHERNLKKILRKFRKLGFISKPLYMELRPTGSVRPRMYGLPKTHKPTVPLRPILSMIGSSQHKIAQWLTEVLQPVLEKFSSYCIKDSFSFVELMRELTILPQNSFLCSYDIKSLFTNVPLCEVIKVCTETLYEDSEIIPPVPKTVFKQLLEFATGGVEFSFNDIIYRQIDGVAMGSPLGPILANIFVGYLEKKLFSNSLKPEVYVRYVDDIFVLFREQGDHLTFLDSLNILHPSLSFTCECEINNKLAFLDVLVERESSSFTTTVYRKPTFSGLYVRWESFCSKRRKTNLIATLTNRAIKICSATKLDMELKNISDIFQKNGYPEDVISSVIKRTLRNESRVKRFGPNKCSVPIHLPYIGTISHKFEEQLSTSVTRCFGAVKLRVVFQSRPMMQAAQKDKLPTTMNNNVIYKFACQCGSWYIGRTSQRLQTRIGQHVPKNLRKTLLTKSAAERRKIAGRYSKDASAIAKHLLNNPACADAYDEDCFSIIAHGRTKYHLSVQESILIEANQPKLCVQKRFVYRCLLFSNARV